MSIINTILLIINVTSFVCILIISPFAIIDHFAGLEDAMKFLKRLKIPWSSKVAAIVCYVIIGIFLVSYFLRKILFQ